MSNAVHFRSAAGAGQYLLSNIAASWPMPVPQGVSAAGQGANAIRLFSTHLPAWIAFGAGAVVGPNAPGSIFIPAGVAKFITGMVSTAQGDQYADAGNPIPGQFGTAGQPGALPPIVFDTSHPAVIFDPTLWAAVLAATSFSAVGQMNGGQIAVDVGTISFSRT